MKDDEIIAVVMQLQANPMIEVPAGGIIFHEGSIGDSMYLIVSGTVEVLRIIGGSEQVLNLLGAGDFFGELALLHRPVRSASTRARTAARLVRIERKHLQKLIQLHPEVPIRIIRQLARSLDRAEAELDRLLRDPESWVGQPPSAVQPLPKPVAPPLAPAAAPAKPAPQPQAHSAAAAASDTAEDAGSHALAELRLAGGRMRWPINAGEWIVGRTDPVTGIEPYVDLGRVDQWGTVAYVHAKLQHDGKICELVEDVSARFGTQVNGVRLTAGVPVRLMDGDRIAIGEIQLRYVDLQAGT